MNPTRSIIAVLMAISACVAHGGFDSPKGVPDSQKYADGEKIGLPRRPNLHHNPENPKSSPFRKPDAIPTATRDKLEAIFENQAKRTARVAAWNAIAGTPAGTARFRDEVAELIDASGGPGTWAGASPAQRDAWVAQGLSPEHSGWINDRIWEDMFESAWAALSAAQKTAAINAKKDAKLVKMMGQAAFDALSAAEKQDARDDIANEIIRIMRCNLETAIKMVECTNPAVGACLRAHWEAGRLCVDFKSRGAAGMMQPHEDGKPAGCDVKKSALNIGLQMFPCHKVTTCYDPAIYGLFTTLLHEGQHGIQAMSGKLGNNPTAAECAGKAFERVALEFEAHGLENSFIDLLCARLLDFINPGPPTSSPDDLVQKIVDKIDALPAGSEFGAALALKGEITRNLISNAEALAYYTQLQTFAALLQSGAIDKATFDQSVSALRKVEIRHLEGQPEETSIIAGGGTNEVIQVQLDPADASEVNQNFGVPVDQLTEIILSPDGQFLMTFGNDDLTLEGVVHAFQDQNGDGFFDDFTGLEILRDPALYGAVDASNHEVMDRFMAVNLWTGEILRLHDPLLSPLPTQIALAGLMNLAGHAWSSVETSDDFTTLYATQFIGVGVPTWMEPGQLMELSQFDPLVFPPQPLPFPPLDLFDVAGFNQIISEASGLPVHDPHSTVNTFTEDLIIRGMPNQQFELHIVPELPGPPIVLGPFVSDPQGVTGPILLPALNENDRIFTAPPGTGDPLSADYFVRSTTPWLTDLWFEPGAGLHLTINGIPGLEYQFLAGPDPSLPLPPIGPPLLMPPGGQLPLPPDPGLLGTELMVQALVIDPRAPIR